MFGVSIEKITKLIGAGVGVGAIIGAGPEVIIGAGVGAIIGTGAGAIIGTGLGAIIGVGAIIGAEIEIIKY